MSDFSTDQEARKVREIQDGEIQIFSKSCSDNSYMGKYDVLNGI